MLPILVHVLFMLWLGKVAVKEVVRAVIVSLVALVMQGQPVSVVVVVVGISMEAVAVIWAAVVDKANLQLNTPQLLGRQKL